MRLLPLHRCSQCDGRQAVHSPPPHAGAELPGDDQLVRVSHCRCLELHWLWWQVRERKSVGKIGLAPLHIRAWLCKSSGMKCLDIRPFGLTVIIVCLNFARMSGGVCRSMYTYWVIESLSGVNMTLIDRYLSRINPNKVLTQDDQFRWGGAEIGYAMQPFQPHVDLLGSLRVYSLVLLPCFMQHLNGSTYGLTRLVLPSSFIEPGVYRLQLTLVRTITSRTITCTSPPLSSVGQSLYGRPIYNVHPCSFPLLS